MLSKIPRLPLRVTALALSATDEFRTWARHSKTHKAQTVTGG